jgi:hypothetical protein
MMKRTHLLSAFVVLSGFVFVSSLSASFAPFVTGESTASLIEDGDFAGLYRYDIFITWKMGANLSQLDLLLEDISQNPDYEIVFPTPAATSTSIRHRYDPLAATWTAYLKSNGLCLFGEDDPYIKYVNPRRPKAGRIGFGTFSFYSNIAPEYGTFDDVLIAQANYGPKVFGDLCGDYPYPSCGNIPEPATILLLGLGSCLMVTRKKRR